MQPTTYLKLIAGSVPDHGQGMVDDTLRLMAQEALGANEIHYLRSPEPVGGRYHYLAVPSAALASELSPVTQLAMALPGHPEHRGVGVYVLEAGQYTVAVIYDGQEMDLVCNESSVVQEFLNDQTLQIHAIPVTATPWRFGSAVTKRNQLVEALSVKLTMYSVAALVVLGVVGLGLAALDGWNTAKLESNNKLTAQALSSALATIQVGSPLSRQLASYEKKSAVAVRAGGWVDAYQVADGKESFRMFVPNWISPDYKTDLGDKVAADRDPADEQLLILTKGTPAGGPYITSKDTVAHDEGSAPPAPGQPPVPTLKKN